MQLRKFVEVVAARELAPLTLQRQHRQLHHVFARDQVIKEPVAQRVDHILAVLHHEDLERDAFYGLITPDGVINPVQAIGFVGRSRVRHRHANDARSDLLEPIHFTCRRRVVRIGAHENHVVRVVEPATGV